MKSNINTATKLDDFRYLGEGNFIGHVFCSTLEGTLVRGFLYENGKNVEPLQFKLKDDLTDEMKENLKDEDYISYSFADVPKTKAGTYSLDEGGGGWNSGDMGEVVVVSKCSGCGNRVSQCTCTRCFWCGNKRCTCQICTKCSHKMRECICYTYPGGGGTTPPPVTHKKTQTILKNAAKTAVQKYSTDAYKDSEDNYLARCNLGVQEAFKSAFGTNPFEGMNANSMVDKLANSADWQKVQMSEVQQLANDGWFVIVGYKASSGSGHVAVIVPGTMTHSRWYGANVPNTMDTGAGMRTESQPLRNFQEINHAILRGYF